MDIAPSAAGVACPAGAVMGAQALTNRLNIVARPIKQSVRLAVKANMVKFYSFPSSQELAAARLMGCTRRIYCEQGLLTRYKTHY
jgi:hypothetical protein